MAEPITITIDPDKLIVTTGHCGGYLEGRCVVCDESGWKDKIIHKKSCPLCRIIIEDVRTWPNVGSTWRHHDGNQYRVLDYVNTQSMKPDSDKRDRYPVMIVYQNILNNEKYARRLDDWQRSMTHIEG